MWIRPAYEIFADGRERLTEILLCLTQHDILVDEHIVERFPADESGKNIETQALESLGASVVHWGTPICTNRESSDGGSS